jgi:hypothetical protein
MFHGKSIWVNYLDYIERNVKDPCDAWAEAAERLIHHGAARWVVRSAGIRTENVLLGGHRELISHTSANQIDLASKMEALFGGNHGPTLANLLRSKRLSIWKKIRKNIADTVR